ncbi:MAG TPA: DNA-binding domain-containing protein, partial [Chthoniobacterales bacterium]
MKPAKPAVSSNPPPPPPDLLGLQRLMAAAVMRPLDARDRTRKRWSDGRPTAEIAEGFIKPNDRLTSIERLEIYNRQYWFRLLDCLYDDYPGLRAVLGSGRFMRLLRAYLTAHPSESFTLRNLGAGMVAFLRRNPKWTEPHSELAVDMARLEWAQIEAFDNPARPPLQLGQLSNRPPGEIFLRLQPHLTLLDLAFPIDEWVVKLLREDDRMRSEASNAVEAPDPAVRRSIARKIPRSPIWLAVHRVENEVYFKRLEAAQFQMLRALESGLSLEAACAEVPGLTPDQLQAWFANWAALGWFWMK